MLAGIGSGLGACGTPDDTAARGTPDRSSTTTTGTPDRPCPLGTEDVSAALGVTVSGGRTDDDTCSWTGSGWSLNLRSGPPPTAEALAASPPSSTLPDVPPGIVHEGGVGLDRGGRWAGSAMVATPRALHLVTLMNSTGGSDTYPPGDGPAQRPPTSAALAAVVRGLADR